MVSEYEMPIRPVGQSTTDLEPDKSDKSHSDVENVIQLQASAERGFSVVSNDGKARSKWRLITIVTALFVRFHLYPIAAKLTAANSLVALSFCGSFGCHHCSHRGTNDIS